MVQLGAGKSISNCCKHVLGLLSEVIEWVVIEVSGVDFSEVCIRV